MDTWQHWPGCGTYPFQPARSGLLGMQKSVRRQKLCEREQERERNGGAATLELLNQRGKESENVCHRRRIRIGGREGGAGAGGSLAHAILAIKVPIDGCSAGKG